MCLHTTPCAGWKKRQGGQLKTWTDVVKTDLETVMNPVIYGVLSWKREWLNVASKTAKNRPVWRRMKTDILEALMLFHFTVDWVLRNALENAQ